MLHLDDGDAGDVMMRRGEEQTSSMVFLVGIIGLIAVFVSGGAVMIGDLRLPVGGEQVAEGDTGQVAAHLADLTDRCWSEGDGGQSSRTTDCFRVTVTPEEDVAEEDVSALVGALDNVDEQFAMESLRNGTQVTVKVRYEAGTVRISRFQVCDPVQGDDCMDAACTCQGEMKCRPDVNMSDRFGCVPRNADIPDYEPEPIDDFGGSNGSGDGTNDTDGTDNTNSTDDGTDDGTGDGSGDGTDDGTGDGTDDTDGDGTSAFRVHGFYPSWAQYNDRYLPEEVSFGKHDSVSAFSVEPSTDGSVVFNEEVDDDMLAAFRDLKQGGPAADTPIYLTVGGWFGSTYFSDAARTQENRQRFAETAVSLMRQYNLDGIDIDWEYPTGGGAEGNVHRAEDVDNVVLLLEAVRNELDAAEEQDGREYALNYAAPHQQEKIQELPTAEMDQYIDTWYIMAFEMSGGWASMTRHDAPAHGSPSMEQALTDWVETGGIAPEDLVVMAGLYGKEFSGVPPGSNGDGLHESFDAYEGEHGYDEVAAMAAESGWEQHWDADAGAAYLYNADQGRWITYTSPRSVREKVSYAQENGYGGFAGWETSWDPNDTLLDAVNDAVS